MDKMHPYTLFIETPLLEIRYKDASHLLLSQTQTQIQLGNNSAVELKYSKLQITNGLMSLYIS